MRPKTVKWLNDIAAACDFIVSAAHDAGRRACSGSRLNYSFRNILIHGYDLVDHKRVWEVIQRDVPALRTQIATILQSEAKT
jgi:hypothetical protein